MKSELSKKIKEIRLLSGWTHREEAAKKIGCSEKSLGNYERGDRIPGLDFLAEFALATNADFSELLRLRLEAGGNSPEALGIQVQESPGEYNGLRAAIQPPFGATPPGAVAIAELRQRLRGAGIPVGWALLVVQLVTSGDLTPIGAEAIIEFLSTQKEAGDA